MHRQAQQTQKHAVYLIVTDGRGQREVDRMVIPRCFDDVAVEVGPICPVDRLSDGYVGRIL